MVLCVVQFLGLSSGRDWIGQVAIYFLMLILSWWAHWLVAAPACHQTCQGLCVPVEIPVVNRIGSSEICSANGLWVLRHARTPRSFCMVLQVEVSCFITGNHLVTLEKKVLFLCAAFFQLWHTNISMLPGSYFSWNSPEYDLESWKDIQFRSHNLKKIKRGAGEMVRWLRALTIPVEDPGLVLRTQLDTHDLQLQVQVFCCRLLASTSTAHTWCTYRPTYKTLRHIK